MLVSRAQLLAYDISADLFFSRRTGEGEPISRDMFFIDNPGRLNAGLYCAIGSDSLGWQLELYNGVNWKTVEPDSSYALIITTAGLAALTNVQKGGLQLYFSGIKIVNHTVINPAIPIVNWTDNEFLQAGEIVFSVGTIGSPNTVDADGNPLLSQILKWRFNSATGGLQYIVTLPPEGLGAIADNGKEQWNIGAIGLYVKDPTNNTSDILFGVATLPNIITKYATNIQRVGNSIKLYFNTILSNLGVVSNLDIMEESDQSIPEVPNETLLNYPSDPKKRIHNCYLVDNLYGTGMPAIAVPRTAGSDLYSDETSWAYIQPTDNFINTTANTFASNVSNYMFVYWNPETKKYELAEGRKVGETPFANEKMPIGIRIGNSIVFSGEVVNKSVSYSYDIQLANGGVDYAIGDELLILANDGLTFKIQVTAVNETGAIRAFGLIGPSVGSVEIEGNPIILPAVYDPRSQLPRYGNGGRFLITARQQTSLAWDFPAEWLNMPLYCDNGENAGKATLTKTDSFLGWCTGTNSIRMALDLRNEASTTVYGTTRYATNDETKEVLTNANAAEQTAVTPKSLQANYLQITKPANTAQAGATLANPVNVQSFVRFNEIVMGKGAKYPYDSTAANPNITDSRISFYGVAYHAEWADLAEFYEADQFYEPGTLICFGKGQKEISLAADECNGIISSNPGYQLGMKKNENWLPVALTGRVPVLFDGMCMPKFGDKIYLSKFRKGCASTVENGKCLGKVLAKNFGTNKLIECVVRIDF